MNKPGTNDVFVGLNAMGEYVFATSKSRGWHTQPARLEDLPRYLMNLHAEISELWEAWRRGTLENLSDHEGLALSQLQEELADILIRTLDLGAMFGLDLEHLTRTKDAYNRQRAYRHGGKLV